MGNFSLLFFPIDLPYGNLVEWQIGMNGFRLGKDEAVNSF